VLTALCFAGITHSAYGQSLEARQVIQATNADRAQHGLGPLQWDPALARAAQRHADLMVRQGALSHQYAGEADLVRRVSQAGGHFREVAENLAVAQTPVALETEWMHSPSHRQNILDPQLNRIGVGVVRQGSSLWAVEDFSTAVAALGSSQIEGQVERLLSQRGLRPEGDVRAARQTCAMDHGSAGNVRPRFIMRWQASELNRLPEVLEQQISTGKFRTAAVGSCDTGHGQPGFTTYRLAVLLF
jgi:hypothetical protein